MQVTPGGVAGGDRAERRGGEREGEERRGEETRGDERRKEPHVEI